MAGHKEDCICPRCCMADMDEHLASIGLDPADYPIRGGYQATGNRSGGTGKAGSGSSRKPHPMSMATMKQVYWLYTMGQSKDITGAPAGVAEAIQKANETSGIEHLTRDAIGRSETITLTEAKALDWLFKAPYKPRETARTKKADAAVDPAEGIYQVGEEIYKVQTAHHGSGKKYAKKLDLTTGKFDFAPGAVVTLAKAEPMTLETALKVVGKLRVNLQTLDFCFACGRPLTDEASMERGMGSICYDRT